MLKKVTLLLALCLCLSASALPTRAEAPKMALTFDDGPHPVYTPKILDILKENNIRATFFLIGENAEKHPEIVRRIIAEGHEIGNHTYSHPHLQKINEKQLTKELKKTEDLLLDKFGYRPVLFRPPEGFCCAAVKNCASNMNYTLTLWDIDTTDWAHNPVKNIVNTVTSNAGDGRIILCHDFVTKPSPTPEAIEIVIPRLKAMGYNLVTVSELKKTDP